MVGIPFELKGKTVYVAGHRGMVGSALVRRLGQENVETLTVGRRELDLRPTTRCVPSSSMTTWRSRPM